MGIQIRPIHSNNVKPSNASKKEFQQFVWSNYNRSMGGNEGQRPASPSRLKRTGSRKEYLESLGQSPKMVRSHSKKKGRMRTHRYTSNVFSMFNQAQIQEFKEAFNMIDQNRDGFIDKEDLIEMLTSLGKSPTEEHIDGMINDAPGPLNFTMFLTLFGEKLNGTDPEDVIKNAFACFDFQATGKVGEDQLREIMTTMGDRWSHDMVDELFYGAPIKNGDFDYIEFTRMLKHGGEREEAGDDKAKAKPPEKPSHAQILKMKGYSYL